MIPILYMVVLANFAGMWLITAPSFSAGMSPLYLLVGAVIWRLSFWLRLKHRKLTIVQMRAAIRQTAFFALAISLGFAVWGHYLISTRPDVIWLVVLFAGLAATGAAYGLMSFPLAAAIPIVVISLSLAVRLLLIERPEGPIVGICLALVSALILRILYLQNRTLQEMVASRLSLETERKNLVRAEKAAATAARTDALTGLANRRSFMESLTRQLDRDDREIFTLGLVDLDGFKPINDVFGHNAGDAILKGIAESLSNELPESVLLARMGGDEFAFLAPGLHCEEQARALGKQVCAAIAKPVNFQGRRHQVDASCGMAFIDCSVEVSAALQYADQALYKAKGSRTKLRIFDAELRKQTQRRALVERCIVTDTLVDELHIAYQPIIDLRQPWKVLAYEVLARWSNAELGTVSPAEFIPTAEGANAIEGISSRCLVLACEQARDFQLDASLSFNLSAIELCERNSSARILSILRQYEMAPEMTQFEITETAPLGDLEVACRNVADLREAGCAIALDDFGAGNASITYLRQMQFDTVKIDGALIKDIESSTRSRQLFKATVDLCHTMGMKCVAEKVETEKQLHLVQAFGCDAAQGNLIASPGASYTTPLKEDLRISTC